jgi:hypothetical protein
MQIKTSVMRKRNIRQFLTKPQGRWENTETSLTFTTSRETAALLKEIAAAGNTTVQELLADAVREWLARRPDASGFGFRQTASS